MRLPEVGETAGDGAPGVAEAGGVIGAGRRGAERFLVSLVSTGKKGKHGLNGYILGFLDLGIGKQIGKKKKEKIGKGTLSVLRFDPPHP